MKMKQSQQSGFTLIELVMVIVILGILAATALPKFVNLSDDAEKAALQGVVGAVNSAFAINYAASVAGNTEAVKFENTVALADLKTRLGGMMQGGAMPTGYSVDDSSAVNCTGRGNNVTITIKNSTGDTATANLICTGGTAPTSPSTGP